MLECLQGFQELYSRYGFVAVDRDMIGVTQKGIVKVWLNNIYSRNLKEPESDLLKSSLTKKNEHLEANMVGNIHRIVSKQARNN